MDKILKQQATQASIDCLGRVSPAFEEGYIKGAMAEREVYGKLLLEIAVDEQRATIEQACEWLEDHAIDYVGKDGITRWRDVFKDFKSAMTAHLQ